MGPDPLPFGREGVESSYAARLNLCTLIAFAHFGDAELSLNFSISSIETPKAFSECRAILGERLARSLCGG